MADIEQSRKDFKEWCDGKGLTFLDRQGICDLGWDVKMPDGVNAFAVEGELKLPVCVRAQLLEDGSVDIYVDKGPRIVN